MSSYILSCCSTSDLMPEQYKEKDIKVLLYHFYLGDKEYADDFGKSIAYQEFYQRMRNGEITKTAQINCDHFIEFFEPFLKKGKDILHICFSSGLSGTYQSALIAKDMLDAKYPDRKLLIVDSLCASSGYGLFVNKIADLRKKGLSIEEAYNWANENRLKVHHWFFSTDLTFYVRGGRITKSAGLIGNILHLCPVMNVSYEGKLIPRKKIIGKKRAIDEVINQMVQNADNGLDYDEDCYICNSECINDAKVLKEKIENKFHNLKGKVKIYNIGTTIGSHSGPGTAAIFFFGKKRID